MIDGFPRKACECGCGQPVKVHLKNVKAKGWIKGAPKRFVRGHAGKFLRRSPVDYEIDGEAGCWLWTGRRSSGGYGMARVPGTRNKREWAHRLYFAKFKGPIPEGFQVDHLCRNPQCVNPDHLEAVTPAVNYARRAA